MKFAALLVLVMMMSLHSVAQINEKAAFYTAKAQRYKNMKNTGAVLTVVGGVLLVAGVVTASHSTMTTTYNSYGSPQTTTTGNPGAAALELLLGTAGLGAGIPLWAVGSHAEKKYLKKMDEVRLGFNIDKNKTALVLTYRF